MVDRCMCVCRYGTLLNLKFLLTRCTSPTPYVRLEPFRDIDEGFSQCLERTNVVVDVPCS